MLRLRRTYVLAFNAFVRAGDTKTRLCTACVYICTHIINTQTQREIALKTVQNLKLYHSKLQTFNKTKYTKNISIRPLEITMVFPSSAEELLPLVTAWEIKLDICLLSYPFLYHLFKPVPAK